MNKDADEDGKLNKKIKHDMTKDKDSERNK